MALDTQLTNLAVNTEADAFSALFNGGFAKIYNGTKPLTGDTALSGNTLLVTLTFGNPAFPAAVAGALASNAITGGVAAASGTATFARFTKSDGTAICDGTVGTATANVIIATTTITALQTVTCTGGVAFTIAKATTGV